MARVRSGTGLGALPATCSLLRSWLDHTPWPTRIAELLASKDAQLPDDGLHVYLTDTLENPYSETLDFGRQLEPLVEETKRARKVKSDEEILVCLGNPPYERLSQNDEQGKQKGGWVVHGEGGGTAPAPIFDTFLSPAIEHTMFSHIASLYNLYVYFWRWALWKVFEAPNVDGSSNGKPGIVSFISASSYLSGPGFLGMREHMRRICDEVWILDLGGEGHGARKEPNVFAIQTPVAICIAARGESDDMSKPAGVSYARIRGDRAEKLAQLESVGNLADVDWQAVPTGWHDPFLPEAPASWTRHPALGDLFPFQLPGTKIGRTWPVAITKDSAEQRWSALARAPLSEKSELFPDSRFGRSSKTQPSGGYPPPASMERIADLTSGSPNARIARYGYRSFDRQWIVADIRVMSTPRQNRWWAQSDEQLYLVSLMTAPVGDGPAGTVFGHPPDLHAFRGSTGGRDVLPLYRDPNGTPNIAAGALSVLSEILDAPVAAEDLFAYSYALLSCRAYTERFRDELETPGPRVPITRDRDLFERVVTLGRLLINLHTFGERLPELGRGVHPGEAKLTRPIGPAMPEEFRFDAEEKQLLVGNGVVEPVETDLWDYEVSGYFPLRSWLAYRMREPVGKAKSSRSALDRIRPIQWTSELDDELLELVWVLERTIGLEAEQAALLDEVCSGETIGADELPEPADQEREAPKLPAVDGADEDDPNDDDGEEE